MLRGLAVPVLLAALMLAATPAAAKPRDVRTLYNSKCALCQRRDGKANPSLAHAKVRHFNDAAWQKERSDDEIRKSIEDGRDGTLMRSYKDQFSADEIAALVKLIRGFAPAEPQDDDAQEK